MQTSLPKWAAPWRHLRCPMQRKCPRLDWPQEDSLGLVALDRPGVSRVHLDFVSGQAACGCPRRVVATQCEAPNNCKRCPLRWSRFCSATLDCPRIRSIRVRRGLARSDCIAAPSPRRREYRNLGPRYATTSDWPSRHLRAAGQAVQGTDVAWLRDVRVIADWPRWRVSLLESKRLRIQFLRCMAVSFVLSVHSDSI